MCQDAGAGGYESFPDVCRLRDGRLLCVFYAGYYHVSLPKPGFAKGGRWVLGVYWEDEAAKQGLGAVLLTDSHGKSWTTPVKIDNAGLRLDAETDIIELRDGRLWAAQRGASGVQLHGSFSSDQGRRTRSPADDARSA